MTDTGKRAGGIGYEGNASATYPGTDIPFVVGEDVNDPVDGFKNPGGFGLNILGMPEVQKLLRAAALSPKLQADMDGDDPDRTLGNDPQLRLLRMTETMTDEERAADLIRLLRAILAMQVNAYRVQVEILRTLRTEVGGWRTTDRSDDAPTIDTHWSMTLLQENALGADLDGNGRIFGADFIFDANTELELHPRLLQNIVRPYYQPAGNPAKTWLGERFTPSAYRAGLPEGRYKRSVSLF